jgi:hypothetical protein
LMRSVVHWRTRNISRRKLYPNRLFLQQHNPGTESSVRQCSQTHPGQRMPVLKGLYRSLDSHPQLLVRPIRHLDVHVGLDGIAHIRCKQM